MKKQFLKGVMSGWSLAARAEAPGRERRRRGAELVAEPPDEFFGSWSMPTIMGWKCDIMFLESISLP